MRHHRALLLVGIAFIIVALALQLTTDHPRGGTLTLLTVTESGTQQERGGTAQVALEIKPGTGRVFLDSFPLMRLDTQASTRYARDVACDHLDADCSQYDFYYTIRANSPVVGGPSAGGAIAVLTTAVLDDIPLDPSIAMTGTISSGGTIGPVSGIDAKIDGARRAGITTVVIPTLTADGNATNATGPHERGDVPALSNGVRVVAVGTLDEAIAIFTGEPVKNGLPAPSAPAQYDERMRAIASALCERTQELRDQVRDRDLTYNDSNNYTSRIDATGASDGYARASLCFSQNIELNRLIVADMTARERTVILASVEERIAAVENRTLATPIVTVGDLEVSGIVRERIAQAQDALLGVGNATDPATSADLAYAQERILSAEHWSALFGMPGMPLQYDEEKARRACLAKVAEADERLSYARIYVPEALGAADDVLAQARDASDPTLCLLLASRAAANANVVVSALAIDGDGVDALLSEKIAAAQRAIAAANDDGSSPILAYSYWRYAQNLRADVPYSALSFAEESIELASLELYFPKERTWRVPRGIVAPIIFFCYGAAFMVGVALLLDPAKPAVKKRRR